MAYGESNGHMNDDVTWRHRSPGHLIPRRPFRVNGPLEPSLYLGRFPRYSMANVTQCLT